MGVTPLLKAMCGVVFIHPLGSLSERDFFSGLAQVITLAKTFGTTCSSGALSYGDGDSRGE